MSAHDPAGGELRHSNAWAAPVIVKLSVIRSGSPIAFFYARFPLLEATLVDCTLRRTKTGRLWCAPPKRRRLLANGSAQYDDIIEWDGGGAASRFSSACLEAIHCHTPELLAPLLEGQIESDPRALPRREAMPSLAPGRERA